MTREEWWHLGPLRGIERALDGDFEGAKVLFEKSIQAIERTHSDEEQFHAMELSGLEFHYDAALEVMGEEREAALHRSRALEMFRAHNFQNRLVTVEDRRRGLVEGIQRIQTGSRLAGQPGRQGRGRSRLPA